MNRLAASLESAWEQNPTPEQSGFPDGELGCNNQVYTDCRHVTRLGHRNSLSARCIHGQHLELKCRKKGDMLYYTTINYWRKPTPADMMPVDGNVAHLICNETVSRAGGYVPKSGEIANQKPWTYVLCENGENEFRGFDNLEGLPETDFKM